MENHHETHGNLSLGYKVSSSNKTAVLRIRIISKALHLKQLNLLLRELGDHLCFIYSDIQKAHI
ncbi:hypothetical protein GDO81_016597 [Engystomops pustulosus]|uniref:LAGLIDADG endonuclease n=1 Tax=Engystomops pustulosus TaxID=76066 RepID=A0AAV7AU68_ENGPU|nr:hypothetical protein GDO81_016597 [Engystomops pustulosus]KAG8564791.1 hypothetical protein GDO81_016597 [Engystomops pustulosus]KAG8564792.1 hypothetical protein GDO81_016597 [Engystomops pustulosus]